MKYVNNRKLRISALSILFLAFSVSFGQKKEYTNNAQFDYFKYEGKDPWFDKKIDKKSEFMNPIMAGYYPDPSICRKGNNYYLVNSSFGYFPGVPIFTSKDLVNWKQIGHVLDRPSQFNFTGKGMSRGIFAPAIEYNQYNDTFYMITTDVGGIGNFYVTSKDPLKGWSEPILLPEVKEIDPSFFFDDDGKAYIVHNDEPENGPDWSQQRTIRIHEFDVKTGRTIGKNKEIIRGGADPSTKPIWDEGPHLYKINGFYYLMCAEGGTSGGHSEVIFRSKSPWGPFEAAPYNPILSQKGLAQDRDNIVTSAGHADLIQTPEGEWWAVFLAVRPYDGKNMFNIGRETFLLPVEWENEFPIILRKNLPIPIVVNKKNLQPTPNFNNGNFTYTEDFNKAKLDYSWVFIRTPEQQFHSIKKGKLIVEPLPISIEEQKTPAAVVRRLKHTNFTIETQMDYVPKSANDFAGVTLFQNEKFQLLFGKTIVDQKVVLTIYRIAKEKQIVASVVLENDDAVKPLKLKVDGKGDKCNFSYSLNGNNWIVLAENADATNLSTQKAGGFIGTCVGLYATSNHLKNLIK
jgi:alpha-N-arabinofuranosidase